MKLLTIMILLFLLPIAQGALLHGVVYDIDSNPVSGAVVEIGTEPVQRMVTLEGGFSFEIPPGNYTITATRYGDSTDEQIIIARDGTFRLDLFLFPSLEDDTELGDFPSVIIESFPPQPQKNYIPLFIIAALLFCALWLFYWKRKKKGSSAVSPDDQAEDEEQLVTCLKKLGGKATQKEIRKALPYSEAKVSLVVSALEHKGKVQKIKKGRGNIIILK